jgi:cytochrome c2
MIKYVQTNHQKCGIPPQVSDQLKSGHKNTEKMMKQVCAVAHQQATQPRGPAGPSLSDVLGSSASMPTPTHGTKKGGSTFDTLSGNVLTR